MKSLHWLVLASAAVAVAGCSGQPSPEAKISCGTVDSVAYVATSGAPIAFYMVQKSITATDDGAGGPVPANGIVATVISPVASVQICKGDCLDGNGSFGQEKDVTTDDNAILKYTLQLDPDGPFTGSVTESFNAVSQCETDVTIGAL